MPVQNFLDANTAGTPLPPLFASTKREFSGRARGGAIVKIVEGQRVRVLRPYKSGDSASLPSWTSRSTMRRARSLQN